MVIHESAKYIKCLTVIIALLISCVMANAELPYDCAWYSTGGDTCIQSEVIKGPEVWTCIYNDGVPGYCRYCNSTLSAYDWNGRMHESGTLREVSFWTTCMYDLYYYCTSTGTAVSYRISASTVPINPGLCPACETINSDQDGFSSCFDCDDSDASINPFAPELCDGKDNNCDGLIDDACSGEDNYCHEELNSTKIGSSANLASGNLYHSQTILRTSTPGIQTHFVISYNSLDTTAGALGRGWVHNYNEQIIDSGNTLAFIEPDGKRVYYRNSGGSVYYPDSSSGRHSTITKNADGSYLLAEKSGTKFSFDNTGRLTGITDRNDNTLSLSYTGYDLTLITDSSGRQTALTYDSDRKITSITDPAGRTTVFAYNGEFLTSVTDPAGGTWTYAYDADGRMQTKTDPLGHAISYSYDADGKITSSVDAEGNIKTIAYAQTNQTAVVTEKNGSQRTYIYDNRLNAPLQVTDADANQTIYQYDSDRNLLSKTESDGRTVSYTYDADGNMLSETDALGNTTNYTYNSFGQALTKTDPDGNITSFVYDTTGNLLQEIDAQGNITSYTYGAKGEKLSETDPEGNTTAYTYDQYGNITSITNALNQTITSAYDITGNLISMTDANGNTTTYEYDLNDRLIKEVKPDGGTVYYEYDPAGNRTAMIDANGNRTTFAYDNLNRLAELLVPDSGLTTYVYDAEGNMTSMLIKDSNGSITTSESYTYNANNRLMQTTRADGAYTEQGYDIHGNLISRKDENGNITTYAYNALNRLLSVTDAAGGTTSYTYDSNGNLKSVTDANGNITLYSYDSLNRLISVSGTGTITYIYDANGNLISKTDANGVSATYAYDSLNRLTAIQFPDSSQNIYYYYDDVQLQNSNGRLTAIIDPSGTSWYDYDKAGRVSRETKEISGLIYRTEYAYDLNGNIKTATYPGGKIIAYEYNQSDKILSVAGILNGVTTMLADNIAYIPFGDIASITTDNGIMTTKSFDSRYMLNSLNIGPLKQLSYTKDGAGNITAATDNINPAKTKAYTYDILNRLQTADGIWGNLNYTYDSAGNRLTETHNTNSTTYSYTADKLISSAGAKPFDFSYDNNGNTISELRAQSTELRQYIYNQNQRLTQVTDTDTVLGEYVYNSNGQRVKKFTQNSSQCSIFHYDQNGLLIAESTGTGAITAEYVYLNGAPLAKIEGNNVYYYHTDHLGTPMMMTNEAGQIVWEGEFMPFGEPVAITGTVTNNLRFAGQYYDAETGMHQNWHRDYKPEIGRYVEADSILQPMVSKTINSSCTKSTVTWHVPLLISNPQNLYPYIYTANNPVNFTDPKGMLTFPGTNWCGPGGSGSTTGCMDSACKRHDKCYEDCGIDAKTRWYPSNIAGGCAAQCDKTLLKDWKKCACSREASGSW